MEKDWHRRGVSFESLLSSAGERTNSPATSLVGLVCNTGKAESNYVNMPN